MEYKKLYNGNISKNIIKLALPLLVLNTITMGYNFIDIFFIGKISNEALSAVGIASLFDWLSDGIIMFITIGGAIFIAESVGDNNKNNITKYCSSTIIIGLFISILYSIFTFLFKEQIMGIFNLDDITDNLAISYLSVSSISFIFLMMNQVFSAIYVSLGHSKQVLYFILIGLIVNTLFDPILIIYLDLGVTGAAISTIIGSLTTTVLFLINFNFNNISLNFRIIKFIPFLDMIKISFPIALQNIYFTIISICLSQIISSFGNDAIIAQRTGAQIEGLVWLIGLSISSAFGSFIAQNAGANRYNRIKDATKYVSIFCIAYGLLMTLVFIFLGADLFSIFSNAPTTINNGGIYLKILGISQIFVLFDVCISALFINLKKVYIPMIISISCNTLLIIFSIVLTNSLGAIGVWISLTTVNILKGVSIFTIFLIKNRTQKLYN